MEAPPVAGPKDPAHRAIDENQVDAARAGPARYRVVLLMTVLCAAGLFTLGTWCTYWADQRNDQYQLINLGQCVYDGGRLYVDCWENKPPGIAWVNALGIALSGGGQLGAWLLPGLTALLSLVVTGYAIARVLSRCAACLGVLLASVVWSLRLYDTPSINPDFYSAMLELAACSVWIVSLEMTGRVRRFACGLAAGLVWAAAATFKQTGLVGLLAVSVVAAAGAVTGRGEGRRWAAVTALAWIGLAIGLGAVTAVLAHQSTLAQAWEAIFVFNRGLASAEAVGAAAGQWPRALTGLAPIQLPLWLGLVGIVATLRTGVANRLSNAFVTAVALWWIAQVLLALIGPSRSMRYWQATFPAMLWLAGVGIYHLEMMFRRLETSYRIPLAVVCATVALLLCRPLADHYLHGVADCYVAYSREETQRGRLAGLGREIQRLVPEGRAIYVWSYDAGAYLYASRSQASRFSYPRSADQMQEILSDLAAGKAWAILIPVSSDSAFDRWCDEACNQTLSDILTGYEVKTTIDRYQVWTQSTGREPGVSTTPCTAPGITVNGSTPTTRRLLGHIRAP